MEDRSNIRFNVTAAEGSSFNYTQKISDDISNYLYDSVPERDFVFSRTAGGFGATSSNSAQPRLSLIDPKLRGRTQNEIANDLQKKLTRFNDAGFSLSRSKRFRWVLDRGEVCPVQFILENQDLNKLRETIPKFLEEVRKDKTFSNADVNLKFNKPEIQLTVDRMKIKDLGLTTSDVIAAIQAAFSGGRLAYFTMNGFQYQVIAQVERDDRNKTNDIEKLYVRNNVGKAFH